MKDALRRLLGPLVARLLCFRSRPYPFGPGPALVVAPHADDETLGCGGLLALKRARGEPVEVVFVTDSAGSPEAAPAAGLAARRRREALAALAVLGTAAQHVHFLDAPDGRLNRLTPTESRRVLTALAAVLEKIRPAEVFLPYLGEGSTEHDAAGQLTRDAVAAAGLTPRLWEYPVWAWWNPVRLAGQLSKPAQNFTLRLGAARATKLSALACHASQLEPAGPRGEPSLPRTLAALCTGPVEFYFNRQS
jgi:LmbE family N-acetylglucosaminyl deacetylase